MFAPELREKLGISNSTLYRMEKEGLPFTKFGRNKVYDYDQVYAWLNQKNANLSEFKLGSSYSNEEISSGFKCGTQGGMRRSHTTNTLVLFTDRTKEYADRWEIDENGEEVLHYTGMGLEGNQSLDNAQNRTLANSHSNGIHIYLFETMQPGEHFFRGEVHLSAEPYTESQKNRKVWMFPLKLVVSNPLPEQVVKLREASEESYFNKHSANILREKADEQIYASARIITTIHYERNKYLKAYVKKRAEGKCEFCGSNAPFQSDDGEPFLEIHHIIWLSRGGADDKFNTCAVCPNCHRKIHYFDDRDTEVYLLDMVAQKETEQ
ncbi:HNH endonuclease [Alkalicoccus urumqiensis]|uniref:Restriction endonuclease n=1 Tax=Alkalicoccus urumqiensis TaxID=1548213 RepID=A0A2P6ME60_ALKUR|nr:HNH endonuclease [Alkalicoccus urumqiensis]PRO64560.1 restriction endonuclease [Alkalicoccus urumqiensis]